jgi:hypothetical protein
MLSLVLKAYLQIMLFGFYLWGSDFASLSAKVRHSKVADKQFSSADVEEICAAVDRACIWYWREVLCLQRSAATTCLLRKQGIPAELVVGAQQMPFRAHAWVEVEGRVVNDKSYLSEIYAVLDRC